MTNIEANAASLERMAAALPINKGYWRKGAGFWAYSSVDEHNDGDEIFLLDGYLSSKDSRLIRARGYPDPDSNAAFATIFHKNSKEIWLCRDAFGSRSLYYKICGDGIIATTFLPALLTAPGVSRSPDEKVLESIAIFGSNIFPGRTTAKEVKSVPPGWVLTFDNGQWKLRRWAAEFESGKEFDMEALDAFLEEQLPASFGTWFERVGSGALAFSGGLDSTCILAIARNTGQKLALHTQCAPTEKIYSEAPDDADGAKAIAIECGWDLTICPIDQDALDRAIVDYMWHTALPLGGNFYDLLGGAAFHALCGHAARNYGAIYCGEGADELFLGYYLLHVDYETTLKILRLKLATASPELQEKAAQMGLFGSLQEGKSALRNLALHHGMGEYHLASVHASASAWGINVATPYVDRMLWSNLCHLNDAYLVDLNTFPAKTKLPLRRFLRRHAAGAAMERAATRRKRAMAYAATATARHWKNGHQGLFNEAQLPDTLSRLYYKLHVEPGYASRPRATIEEILS